MEKIRERKFLYFWGPQALIGAAGVVAAILGWIPFVGVVFSVLMGLCTLAATVFITVYQLYFYYQLSLDVNAACVGDGVETKSYLYVLALNSVTLGIYGKYWIYKLAQRMQANAPRYGFKMIVGGKEVLVLDILSGGWISAWEFIRNMNKIAKVYNQQGVPELVGGVQ